MLPAATDIEVTTSPGEIRGFFVGVPNLVTRSDEPAFAMEAVGQFDTACIAAVLEQCELQF
jgi:aminoglycoside N3'-acetyltransferase